MTFRMVRKESGAAGRIPSDVDAVTMSVSFIRGATHPEQIQKATVPEEVIVLSLTVMVRVWRGSKLLERWALKPPEQTQSFIGSEPHVHDTTRLSKENLIVDED